MEERLARAMQSGDEETKSLRQQLAKLQDEFEAFKVKSRKSFEHMQASLKEEHEQAMEQLRRKYE